MGREAKKETNRQAEITRRKEQGVHGQDRHPERGASAEAGITQEGLRDGVSWGDTTPSP